MPLKVDPAYKARPELYAYNTATKRHCLKSSVRYKKGFRRKPEEWVESVTVVRGPAEPSNCLFLRSRLRPN